MFGADVEVQLAAVTVKGYIESLVSDRCRWLRLQYCTHNKGEFLIAT